MKCLLYLVKRVLACLCMLFMVVYEFSKSDRFLVYLPPER